MKRNILVLLTPIFAFGWSAIAVAQYDELYYASSENGNIWLVSVGISEYYRSDQLTSLPYVLDGAYKIASIYERRQLGAKFPVLTNSSAKRKDILQTLESTFVTNPGLKEEDMIIFFFTGHGAMAGENIGICPYDYSGDNRDLITDDQLISILRRSKARHKVCILESCKTDATAHGPEMVTPEMLNRFNRLRHSIGGGLVFMTSSQAGTKSWSTPEIGGHFSHFLLKGLEGEADTNGDKIITVHELFSFVQHSVSEFSKGGQIPQINDKGYDPSMPLMVRPSKLPEKPQPSTSPAQEPCEANQTGDFCVENATGGQIWVRLNSKVTPIKNGLKECFYDVKAEAITFRVTNYAPGGGSYTLGGANDYQIRVKACTTVTKVIR